MKARTARIMLDRAAADIQEVLNTVADANSDLTAWDDDPDSRVPDGLGYFVTRITGWAEQGRLDAERDYG